MAIQSDGEGEVNLVEHIVDVLVLAVQAADERDGMLQLLLYR
jgi:hypothetical protein